MEPYHHSLFIELAILALNKLEELTAGFGVIAEVSKHATGHSFAPGLLHASHHHAHVRCFDHDSNACWFNGLKNGLCNFSCQPLLDLQKTRNNNSHLKSVKISDQPVVVLNKFRRYVLVLRSPRPCL